MELKFIDGASRTFFFSWHSQWRGVMPLKCHLNSCSVTDLRYSNLNILLVICTISIPLSAWYVIFTELLLKCKTAPGFIWSLAAVCCSSTALPGSLCSSQCSNPRDKNVHQKLWMHYNAHDQNNIIAQPPFYTSPRISSMLYFKLIKLYLKHEKKTDISQDLSKK